ncbi:very short patch repair endonuclease [Mycobacterium marseillense]|uniref:very short patch repair endonuclease n=1 Tax=Mycobacterium marseillense TaxID=701042 RepID=UPI00259974C4|nr:very short patch repair endonuclease [Mycobacterium marseillense]MDM3973869.1 very short patch repair endonuclease [Mycobacterium marseillense]
MPDSWASSAHVRACMQANKNRDTKPEVALRSAVHALGLRYRVATRPLKGFRRTADMVFSRARVAVFLDGCFWHGCPEHHTVAMTNGKFWADKVVENRARDRDTDQRLADAGWISLRVWEHEDPEEAAMRVRDAVLERLDDRGLSVPAT